MFFELCRCSRLGQPYRAWCPVRVAESEEGMVGQRCGRGDRYDEPWQVCVHAKCRETFQKKLCWERDSRVER
jgi:hypothetical protein